MGRKLTPEQEALLPHVDNPANEDRWGLAHYIARRAGVAPRAVTPMLDALQRHGLVESMREGQRASMRSDQPPRLWRRVA